MLRADGRRSDAADLHHSPKNRKARASSKEILHEAHL